MNKVFEKILERLRNLAENYGRLQFGFNDSCEIQKYVGMEQAVDLAIEIVQEVAEEYTSTENINCSTDTSTDGWIPCSERLPKESLNSVIGWDEYRNRCCFVQYYGGRWILGNDIETVKIIAWLPLPEPYKE